MSLLKIALGAVTAAALAGAAQAEGYQTAKRGEDHAPAAKTAAKPAPKKLARTTPAKPAAHAAETPHTVAPVLVRASQAPSEREIAVLFDLWNAALQTGSPELVASLYAPDAVLLPTVSNRVRTTRYEITDYFQHFLPLQPRGTINQQFIRVLSPDLAMNAGVYTFDLVRDGKPEQVVARYDFLYKRVNGRWLIMDHHSSKMPEPMTGAPMQTASAH